MSVDPEAVADFVDRWGDYVEIFDVVPTAFRGDVEGERMGEAAMEGVEELVEGAN